MSEQLLADEQADNGAGPDPGSEPLAEPGWLTDKQGRSYIRSPHRRGAIYRREDETIAQALERDGQPRDQRPRRKSKPPRKPPPPKSVDLRELEQALAEALKSPAVPCAMFGDAWAADHFTNHGPYLARNLMLAAEHNPWLRRKLEAAAQGGDLMMQLFTLGGLAAALGLYLIPPLVWWLNLPLGDQARAMFGIPNRNAGPPPPTAAQAAQPAPAAQP
jgi:hypothetical protein